MNISHKYKELPDGIIEKLKRANIFYSEQYYNLKQKKKSDVYYIYNENEILIVLLVKKYIFRFVLLPSESFEIGVKDEGFLDKAMKIVKERLKPDWIGPSDTTAIFAQPPKSSINIPFGTYLIDLTQSEEDLHSKLHKSFKRDIKYAARDDVKIICGGVELLEEYIKIDRITWERSNKAAVSKYIYEELFEKFGEYARIYLSYKKNELQSGAFFLFNEYAAYYLYGATANNADAGANKLLQWKAIIDFKGEGINRYNFVGCRINEDLNSKYHGIQKFKAGFGGELMKGYMFKIIVRPWKYTLFRVLAIIKGGGKRQRDIIEQEIHKWKKTEDNHICLMQE